MMMSRSAPGAERARRPDAPTDGPGTVLVTGGASGLGAAVVRGVHAAGGRTVVIDRVPLPAELRPIVASSAEVDLADGRTAEKAVRELADQADGLTAVVTAAGLDRCGELVAVPAEDWELVVQVNLLGTAAVVRAALPYLLDTGGRLVTIASTLGIRVLPDATAYCASKFGVVGFTRALAAETAGRIGVTLVVPGGMRTHFFDSREEKYRPPDDSRLNSPDDVAAAILFALRQPPGSEVRELVLCHAEEPSWP